MLDVVVHAMWGVREQSPGQLAQRWLVLLRGLAEIDGGTCGRWYETAEYDETRPAVELTEAAVAAYIGRQNPEPDADYIGRVAVLSTAGGRGVPRVVTSINAGGSAKRVPDTCAVTIRSRELDESVELVRRSAEVLGTLGVCWDADWGEVYDDDQYEAVEDVFGLSVTAPRSGRSVYLSPGRAAVVPEGLPGTYTRGEGGGLVIDFTRGGTETLSVESVVGANRRLRAAGAMEPLPVPFDRDTF